MPCDDTKRGAQIDRYQGCFNIHEPSIGDEEITNVTPTRAPLVAVLWWQTIKRGKPLKALIIRDESLTTHFQLLGDVVANLASSLQRRGEEAGFWWSGTCQDSAWENASRIREAGAEEDRPVTDPTYRQVNEGLILKC